jgi:RNA polymerase sigma factor (sigma-70 family)
MHPHQRFIEGLKERNDSVIQEIYNTFFPNIEQFIKKNRGNSDDAHDVFQEGIQMLFSEVIKKDFIIQTGLNNWFFMVCRNIWLKKLNKKAKLPVTFDTETELISEENIETQISQNERKQLYLKKLQELSEMCRKILLLFFDKIKMGAIAEQLGYKNANVVKKKKSGCQKKLIELIQADPLYKELKY